MSHNVAHASNYDHIILQVLSILLSFLLRKAKKKEMEAGFILDLTMCA